jgi:hypothetical protein
MILQVSLKLTTRPCAAACIPSLSPGMYANASGSHGLNSVLLRRKILGLAGYRHNDEIERRRNADEIIAK